MATVNLLPLPLVRQESYLEYEYQADLSHGAKVYFNEASLSYEHLVALQAGDKTIKFSLIDAAPDETLIYNDQVFFPEVFPDVDLLYTVENASLKEELLIKTPTARHEFTFDLRQENVTAYLQQDDSIEYRDAQGNPVWTIQAPYAHDAANREVPTVLTFAGNRYTLAAVPDEFTAYPVVLDPTVSYSLSSAFIFCFQNYAGIVNFSYGPTRFDVGRLGHTGIINTVTLSCTRRIKSPTDVITPLYDNSDPNNKCWFQWFAQDGTALTAKQDVLTAGTLAVLTVPQNAYYIEVSGICNGTAQADGNWLAFQSTSITAFAFDDEKAASWEFYTPASLNQMTATARIRINTADNPAIPGTVLTRSVSTEPGYFFNQSALNANNFRHANIWLDPAYCNCYAADGTLLSSTLIVAPTAAGNRSTSVTPPAGCSRIELTGTVNTSGTVPAGANAYLNYSAIMLTPLSYVSVMMVDKDLTNARVAPWFTQNSAWPVRIFTSVNNQADYSETSTVTAAKGGVVYAKFLRDPADNTVNAKIGGVSLLTIAEQTLSEVLFQTNRRVADSVSAILDTLRRRKITETVRTDTARLVKGLVAVLADLSRKTSDACSRAYDLLRKRAVSTSVRADTYRRLFRQMAATFDSRRIALLWEWMHFDTKRLFRSSDWPYASKIAFTLRISPTRQINLQKRGAAMILAGTHAVLEFSARKNEVEPYDLSGAQVALKFQLPDSRTTLERPAEITNPAAGKCRVKLSPEDLPEGGTCRYQLSVVFPDQTVSRSAISSFYVGDSL